MLLFATNRQHSRAVHVWLRERAEEGCSGYPPPAQSGAHPGALQRQHLQESQHPQVKLWLLQIAPEVTRCCEIYTEITFFLLPKFVVDSSNAIVKPRGRCRRSWEKVIELSGE